MRRLRSIHLIFILVTILIIAGFWFGFIFGSESQRQEDLVKLTEAEIYSTANNSVIKQADADAYEVKEQSSKTKEITGLDETPTSEYKIATEPNWHESEDSEITAEQYSIKTGLEYAQPMFYLKQSEEYVSVYVKATDELYFETDIEIESLPIELQEDMKEGIDFTDLEAVYTFLESYSS